MDDNAYLESVVGELGKQYPHEFIETQAEGFYQNVTNHMKAAGISQEILDLLDCVIFCERYAPLAQFGKLPDYAAVELADAIARGTKLHAELGGVFASSESHTFPRENTIPDAV